MKLKIAALTVASGLLIGPILLAANGAETARQPRVQDPTLQTELVQVTLAEMFAGIASHDRVFPAAHGMTIYENPAAEVIIVRRNADGTVSHACVETEQAARRFLGVKQNAAPTNGESK